MVFNILPFASIELGRQETLGFFRWVSSKGLKVLAFHQLVNSIEA